MSEQIECWEKLIAKRMRPAKRTAETVASEIAKEKSRKYEQSPERKEKHRKWNQSPAGKLSMKRRGAKYRASAKGIANSRKKSKKYYDVHRFDPVFIARHKEWDKAYKLRTIPGKLRTVPYTITLMEIGSMTVHVVTTSKVA